MFRLIRFYGTIATDEKGYFSTCSTDYEVLQLVSDLSAGPDFLSQYAEEKKVAVTGAPFKVECRGYGRPAIDVVWAVKLATGHTKHDHWGKTEEHAVYLGLVNLERWQDGTLTPVEVEPFWVKRCESEGGEPVTKDQAYSIVNLQEYGMQEVGELVYGGVTLVKEGWESYHILHLLGYSRQSFLEAMEITEEGFNDDTYRCDGCGKYDSQDNGYTYNHRIVNECERLGVNCGCVEEYAESDGGDDCPRLGRSGEGPS